MKKTLLVSSLAPLMLLLLPACNALGAGEWGENTHKGTSPSDSEPAAESSDEMLVMGGESGDADVEPANEPRAATARPMPAPEKQEVRLVSTDRGSLPVVEKGGNVTASSGTCHACAIRGDDAPDGECPVCRASAATAARGQ